MISLCNACDCATRPPRDFHATTCDARSTHSSRTEVAGNRVAVASQLQTPHEDASTPPRFTLESNHWRIQGRANPTMAPIRSVNGTYPPPSPPQPAKTVHGPMGVGQFIIHIISGVGVKLKVRDKYWEE